VSVGALWIGGVPVLSYGDLNQNAAAINNSGIVVGSYDTGLPPQHLYSGAFHAFYWQAGILTDPGTLSGATADDALQSGAMAINSAGVIVGYSQTFGDVQHAVMWQNGKISDLHAALASLIPTNNTVISADAITDDGQVLLTVADNTSYAMTYYIAKPLIPTTSSIWSSINPSSYGQQVHLVATIKADSGASPQGSVTWYDGGKAVAASPIYTGAAGWWPSTLTVGVHNITVSYKGVNPDASSTSAAFKQTVRAAATRTGIYVPTNPGAHGKAVTLIATVVPAYGTITGTVTFKSGAKVLGTATVDRKSDQARYTTTFTSAGKYSLAATYGATTNFLGSSSPALTLVVK
jgi:probable HAF family extracellular repeat protein